MATIPATMTSETNISDWLAAANPADAVLACDYFLSLAEGHMSRALFTRTQEQFYFAVRYFSRPMAALTARLPDSATRRGLVGNLAEEHGADEARPAALDPAMAHDSSGVFSARSASARNGWRPCAKARRRALSTLA